MIDIKLKDIDLVEGVTGQLAGVIKIAGTSMHIELIEVNGACNAVNNILQQRIDAVRGFDEGDRYETVNYLGTKWFVIIHPFQS